MTLDPNDPWTAEDAQLDRRSVDFIEPSGARTAADASEAQSGLDSLYAFMFVQDIQNALFPTSGSSGKDRVAVASLSFENATDENRLERMAAFGFGGSEGYGRHEFASAFAKWARFCSYSLLRSGETWYELAFIRSRGVSQPAAFRVVHIYSGTVRREYRLWGPYVQRAPANAVRLFRSAEKHLGGSGDSTAITLGGSDRVFRVSLPAGLREFHRATVRLAVLGENQFPAFMFPSRDVGEALSVPYDFDRFKRAEELAVASVTKHIGWHGRGTFVDYETDFYFMKRQLRFVQSLQELRAFLFETANRLLAAAGAEIGFRARIVSGGLPTVEAIDEADSLVDRGEISVKALLDRFSLY